MGPCHGTEYQEETPTRWGWSNLFTGALGVMAIKCGGRVHVWGFGQPQGGDRFLLCPLNDPRLSPPDNSFRQLCPLATVYLPDKWPSVLTEGGRAVGVLQSPPCLGLAQLGEDLGLCTSAQH